MKTTHKYHDVSHPFQNFNFHSSVKIFPPLASVAVFLIGALIVAGWVFNIPALKTIFPNAFPMSALSGVFFLLSGLSLGFFYVPWSPLRERVGRALGFVIFLGALTKICEYWLDWKLESDRLLTGKMENVMAPNTAVNFVMTGMALMLLKTDRWKIQNLFSVIFTAVAAVLSFLAIFGHFQHFAPFFLLGFPIPMSEITAVTFLILSLGSI